MSAYNGNGGFQFLQMNPGEDFMTGGSTGVGPDGSDNWRDGLDQYTEGAGQPGTANNDAGQGGNFSESNNISSQGDMDSYESEHQPGILDKVWNGLHSPAGKIGTTLASLFVPGAGIPLALANLISGWGSDHGAQATLGLLGGATGGLAGGSLGGFLGGMAGGSAGSYLDNNGGPTSSSGDYSGIRSINSFGNSGGGSGMDGNDYGALAGGIGLALNANAGQQGIDKTIGGLQGLYSPNSPYAQQLEQSLQRQDAASGRRSQYGTRSVELQARLADSAARMAPALANMYNQRYQMQNQRMMGFLGAGKAVGAFDPNTYKGLYSMFSGPNEDSYTTPDFAGQGYQTAGNSGGSYPDLSGMTAGGYDTGGTSGSYDPYAGSTGTDSTWDWGNLFGGNSGSSGGSIFGSGG